MQILTAFPKTNSILDNFPLQSEKNWEIFSNFFGHQGKNRFFGRILTKCVYQYSFLVLGELIDTEKLTNVEDIFYWFTFYNAYKLILYYFQLSRRRSFWNQPELSRSSTPSTPSAIWYTAEEDSTFDDRLDFLADHLLTGFSLTV